MLSRFVASAVVMFVIGGMVLAGEYTGVITKIDKEEGVTFKTRGKKKGDKGEEKTIKVSSKNKITKGEDKDKVSAEDFSELVSKAAEGKGKMKGVFAKITTEGEDKDEKVVSIEILKGKGKGKDKKPADKTEKDK